MSSKPNTYKDLDPPETQNSLFQVSQESSEKKFSTLLRYQRQLRSGFDPNLIGSGKFRLIGLNLCSIPEDGKNENILTVPTSEREAESMIKGLHKVLGHKNEKDLRIAVKQRCWIPNITKLIGNVLSKFEACQVHKHPSKSLNLPIQMMACGLPFRKWGMDFVGLLTKTANGNVHFVTAIDFGTGWAYAPPISNISAANAMLLLKEFIRNHGVPEELITNNGTEFCSHDFSNYLKEVGIQHRRTSRYHLKLMGWLKGSMVR